MGFPPEICLIGAQKSGTTSLAYMLDQHPAISVAENKEPLFYTHNWSRGIDWYRKQFPEAATTICVDASPSFTEAPLRLGDAQDIYSGVPEKVLAVNPDTRFIYILRDPVERTYSGYWAAVRHGLEKRAFKDAMFDPRERYLDTSDYHGQLELWLRHFPLESFLILLFEDLRRNPSEVLRRSFRFIGVDDSVEVDTDSLQNRSYNVGKAGRTINRLMIKHPQLMTMKHLFPQGVRDSIKRLKRGSKPIPKMSVADRQKLRNYFRERNKKLEALTGLSLAHW